jgi:two-component system phosphate regulon response regulator PhoB
MTQRKILVVEDEQSIRDMLAFNLGRAGFAVERAADGREARAAIADGFPDIVLMDWMLPDVSGLELTRQLKRDPNTREIPIIMVTARAAEDDRVTGLDGGADDYIAKPFEWEELYGKINRCLAGAMPGTRRT